MTATRKLIRADGTQVDLHGPHAMDDIRQMIGADALDTVLLADRRHVMLVDDLGRAKNLPVNAEATRLYLQRCHAGATHQIRGDVVVVPDDDFAGQW